MDQKLNCKIESLSSNSEDEMSGLVDNLKSIKFTVLKSEDFQLNQKKIDEDLNNLVGHSAEIAENTCSGSEEEESHNEAEIIVPKPYEFDKSNSSETGSLSSLDNEEIIVSLPERPSENQDFISENVCRVIHEKIVNREFTLRSLKLSQHSATYLINPKALKSEERMIRIS